MFTKTENAAIIRPIVLSALARGDAHGYELSQRIELVSGGSLEWNAGTLYPVLHRLEAEDLIVSRWQPSDSGPRRKVYSMTAKGKKATAAEKTKWMEIHQLMTQFWQLDLATG